MQKVNLYQTWANCMSLLQWLDKGRCYACHCKLRSNGFLTSAHIASLIEGILSSDPMTDMHHHP